MEQDTTSCSRCRDPKPAARRDTYCKPCRNEYQRHWRAGTLPPVPTFTCVVCGMTYQPKQRKSDGLYCSKQCHWRAEVVRDARLRRRYGISAADYARLLADQGGGCALCGKRPEEQTRYTEFLHVDHCHDTGRVRGLLCDRHNLLLGRWDHDPKMLRKAADYLET